MRIPRIALALALVMSPVLLNAQTTTFCQATGTGVETPTNRPTCNTTKAVQTTVANVLFLGLYTSGSHNLNATDSVAYHNTWAAMGHAAGTTGTVVTTADSLSNAAAADSVIVLANRPYKLTIQAQTDLFDFDKDASYNVCRNTENSTTSCVGTTNAGKPVKDLYWSKDGTTYTQLVGPAVAGGTSIKAAGTGERYSAPITFKSAWFYATDIPGTYKATVVYTVTGQ